MYLLKMHRFGDENLHSYSVGCYSSLAEAEFMSLVEEYYRGGKYESSIVEQHICESLCVASDGDRVEERINFFFEHCGGY